MGESVVLPKQYPLLLHTITTTSTKLCVTIPTTKPKHWRLFRCSFQLNNKQSINLITSLCWSYFSRRNYFRVIHIIPFLQISKLFLAALQVTGSQQASQPKPTTNEPLPCTTTTTTTTTTTGEHKTTAQRQQRTRHR
jgi:hypothetical protein